MNCVCFAHLNVRTLYFVMKDKNTPYDIMDVIARLWERIYKENEWLCVYVFLCT
jgi:hypothetical protein